MPDVATFSASDGVTIAYHRMNSVDDVKGMPPVFLIHGFASDSQTSWIDPGMTRALPNAGRSVFAVDARGHGTERPTSGMREFRDEVDELGGDRLALAAHLRVFHTDPLPLDRIEAPTLVVAGRDDELSPEPELLAAAIPSGQAMTLPGDHAGTKTTAAFIDAVGAFLDQRI